MQDFYIYKNMVYGMSSVFILPMRAAALQTKRLLIWVEILYVL